VRAIKKGAEPLTLTEHRQKTHSDYDNFQDKEALRNALVTEQRGICCYCMGRIRSDWGTMKIEHWHCQRHYPAEQLIYRNMLGACLGAEGQPKHLRHCDTRKGDLELKWNPADLLHRIEARIRYELDGRIRSDNPEFDDQLSSVLGLNLARLMNNRKGVLDAVLEWWKKEKSKLHGPVPRDQIERERRRRVEGEGELQPYGQVAVWWLEQRLARMAA
jgi:uncharacterized protein (TIGR02646 family)